MQDTHVVIPITYRAEWYDGFGARGWKLDVSIEDPRVIAATAETGERILTSVLVHDILDHYLCGLPLSGHRNEAIALIQLASRTGSNVAADFTTMVDEDLMHGVVSGESLWNFLPGDLQRLVPGGEQDGHRIIDWLRRRLGTGRLRERLIARFFELGEAGGDAARAQWRHHGLDYMQRAPLGLALQALLERADRTMQESAVEYAHGRFAISNSECVLQLLPPWPFHYREPVGSK